VIKPSSEQLDLFYALKLTEPGDARPSFPRDYEHLKSAIEHELSSTRPPSRLSRVQIPADPPHHATRAPSMWPTLPWRGEVPLCLSVS